MNAEILALEQKLTLLATELIGKPEFDRVKLWISRVCGTPKLSDYLRDETKSLKERIGTAEALAEILIGKQYDRLPVAAPTVTPVARADTPEAADEPRFTESDVRRIVRQETAAVMEAIARVLKE